VLVKQFNADCSDFSPMSIKVMLDFIVVGHRKANASDDVSGVVAVMVYKLQKSSVVLSGQGMRVAVRFERGREQVARSEDVAGGEGLLARLGFDEIHSSDGFGEDVSILMKCHGYNELENFLSVS